MLTLLWMAQISHELQLFQDAFVGGESWPFLGSPTIWAWTLTVVGLFIAWWTSWNLIRRDQLALGPANRRFCSALGLDGRDRRLLKVVARTAGIKYVTSMLISEGAFEYASKLHVRWRGSQERLTDIKRKVFGT
ncbi:MAG: hypothetical protein O7G85_05975 [Planctomycetota bacterium]|nr:hypothetical protein [Planctomycetota bacterium]